MARCRLDGFWSGQRGILMLSADESVLFRLHATPLLTAQLTYLLFAWRVADLWTSETVDLVGLLRVERHGLLAMVLGMSMA
eukprot:3937606-Amphidinium_carterae.1